jgi:hypothetical protein
MDYYIIILLYNNIYHNITKTKKNNIYHNITKRKQKNNITKRKQKII